MADYLGKKIKFNIEDNDLQKIRFNKAYGESQQATRSGKNHFDASQIPSSTNIVVSDNGKTITMPIVTSGNGATPTTKKLSQLCPKLKVGDTATLRFNRNLGTTKNMYIYLNVVNLAWNINSPKAITQEMLDSYVSLFANRYDEGETGQCILTDFSIMLSSETDTSWEPYGASPSPDYRSKIENLEGKNKFDINQEKEIFGIMLYKYSYYLKPNTKYTISSNCPASTTANIYANSNSSNSAVYINKNQTIQSDKNGYFYILVRFKADASDNSTFNLYEKVLNGTYYVQVEEGTVATPYVPYNSLEFKDEGENLYNDNIDDYIKPIDYWICPVALEQGETYKLSGKLKGTKMTGCVVAVVPYGNSYSEFKDVFKPYIVLNNTGGVSNRTITVDSSFTSPKLVIYANNKEIFKSLFENYEIQLNKGTVAKPYEPYKQQTEYFPLSEGQKLYQKSYLADDGIHHTRKQYTFTGNEEITLSNRQHENCACFHINNQNIINKQNNYITKEMCSHFVYDSLAYKENRDVECITDNTGIPYRLIIFQILKTRLTSIDVAGFKAYLAEQYANGTPVIVEYELAEEETVPYTVEQQEAWKKLRHFKGLNGENNITAQGTMTSTLDLTLYNVAEEDFDIYISKKGYFGALKYDINNLIDFTESNIPSIAEATESSVKIAGRDGDISLNTVYEPLPFEIVCYTEDNLTPEEKIIEEQKITSLLNSIKNQTKTFFMEREKKFYKVKYSGNLSVVRYPKHLKFTIPLKSSESYAMNFEESEIIGNGIKISNTIKDTGAIFTIKGPATKPIISLNNYQMKYNENILEGNSLIINSEDSTITHITSAGVKTNAMRAYNHEFPKIKNGENQLAVSSGIDDEKQVNVKWYDLKI